MRVSSDMACRIAPAIILLLSISRASWKAESAGTGGTATRNDAAAGSKRGGTSALTSADAWPPTNPPPKSIQHARNQHSTARAN